ncbi:MAG: nuclear transport factor 2 family protein, partial [Gemmatimonadales bacterium]
QAKRPVCLYCGPAGMAASAGRRLPPLTHYSFDSTASRRHCMRCSVAIAAFALMVPSPTRAQAGSAENEVRAFLVEYDRAVAARDTAFLAGVLPPDYVFTGADGRKSDRAQVLRYFAQQRARPSYRMVALKHDNVVVRAVGDMAVVTNDYTSRTTPIAAPNMDPDSTSGRHTAVFEKRNGRWMAIAEQDTEQVHDAKLMERQVTKAGREYIELVKRLQDGRSYQELLDAGDIAALTRTLAEDYVGTTQDGELARKTDEVARFSSTRVRLTSATILEQRVLAIDNNAAIETGTVRLVGATGGDPFTVTTRYTATWVSWGDGWQIVARHSSLAAR